MGEWVKVSDRPVPSNGKPVLLKDPEGHIGIGVVFKRNDAIVEYSEQCAWVSGDSVYLGKYRALEAVEWCEIP